MTCRSAGLSAHMQGQDMSGEVSQERYVRNGMSGEVCQERGIGAADQTRTGPKSLEGSCATTTPQPHASVLKSLKRNGKNPNFNAV